MRHVWKNALTLLALMALCALSTPAFSKNDAPKQNEGKEGAVIETLLEGETFPKKSEFIAVQDEKSSGQPVGQAVLNGAPALGATRVDDGLSYGRIFFSLAFVAGIMLGLAYLWKRIESGSPGLLKKVIPTNGKLKIVAQQPVSFKSKILIVEALGKRYLVGATAERIQLLADLDFFETNEASTQSASGVSTGSMSTFMPIKETLAATAAISEVKKPASFETALQEESAKPPVMSRIKEKLKDLKKISSTH